MKNLLKFWKIYGNFWKIYENLKNLENFVKLLLKIIIEVGKNIAM